MNSNYTEFKFPQIKAHPWNKVRSQKDQSAGFSVTGWAIHSMGHCGLLGETSSDQCHLEWALWY
jgi:hypothetical protein